MFHRYWLATAKRFKFPVEEMTRIIERVFAKMDHVIDQVRSGLPEGFPNEVATPIFDGMRRARDRMGE